MKLRVSLLLLALFAPRSEAWQARFVPLGYAPDGVSSIAYCLNADGTVVGGYSSSPANSTAVRWRVSTTVEVIPEGPYPSEYPASVRALDASGEIAIVDVWESEYSYSFRWSPPEPLEILRGNSGFNDLAGLSADGRIYAVSGGDNYGGNRTYYGRLGDSAMPGTAMTLPSAGGGVDAVVGQGLSSDGRYVVGSADTGTRYEAFRWSVVLGYEFLGVLGSHPNGSSAVDSSADGSVIIGSSSDATHTQAFRWIEGSGLSALGFLPGESNSWPTAVSDDGQIVIGDSGGRPFLWSPSIGMVEVAPYLTSQGAACLLGWQIVEVFAISADGNAIAGRGINPSGHSEGFVAYLDAPSELPVGAVGCEPAGINSTGVAATLQAHGTPCVVDDDLTLVAEGMPANTSGLFVTSLGLRTDPLTFGDGSLCLGTPMLRLPGIGFPSDASGRAEATLSLPQSPFANGLTWHFQAFYRDPASLSVGNLTNSLSIDFH